MLARAGYETPTGGSAEVARLISSYGWADTTWRNRSSQLRKWLRFCDEDDRCPLPATDGDVLAYIGFLSLEGRISSVSLPHYLTAVSKYHELHHLPTPTKTPMIRTAIAAYARRHNADRALADVRIGCPASLMRRVFTMGMACSSVIDIGNCAMVVFAFIFHCRSTSIRMVRSDDITFTPSLMRARIRKRKGKALNRPFYLDYPRCASWTSDNPIALLQKWATFRPDSPGFFDLRPRPLIGSADLGSALRSCLLRVREVAPRGFYYGSHIPRIGAFNELFLLKLPREFIMRRLDWVNEDMFMVYMDSMIVVTPHSKWFFDHLLPT